MSKQRQASSNRLLKTILKRVSRSFYLSLVILPRQVRDQVGLAYLFCRAADTIADTRLVAANVRQQALGDFRRQFEGGEPEWSEIERLQEGLAAQPGTDGEHDLLRHLPDCFRLLRRFSSSDQRDIQDLVLTLTRGMEMDLTQFPTEPDHLPRALPDDDALDRYTYYVAGVVGEFWTRIHVAHLAALRGCDAHELARLGVRFGKGLQMTNILKDIRRDIPMGRCYLPQHRLDKVGLRAPDLLRPEVGTQIRSIIYDLTHLTVAHLDQACQYILILPRGAARLRLSCIWPLCFAVQTLEMICQAENLLHPEARVKISRSTVYKTLLWSIGCLLSNRFFLWYYGRLRQRLMTMLQTG